MAETINMPKLGFDMAEGTLVRWLKKVGEPIIKGDVLAEIETDKATVEVESPAGGVVRTLLVDEGAIVPVGSPIAIVGTADEMIEESSGPSALPRPATSDVHPELIPTRATAPIPTPVEPLPAAVPTPPGVAPVPVSPGKASPLAKRMAREKNLDLAHIKGSGPGGRVVRLDIEAALAEGRSGKSAGSPASAMFSPHADETINLPRLRQAIGRRMAESKPGVPHFYVTREYKMDALLDLRKQFNAIVPEEEKLSINDFIIKATALTLRQFPNLNTSLNGSSLIQHGRIHIGVAVSVQGGLLTVVCRDADQKSLRQVSAEVRNMAVRAREGKVHAEDIEGSTFSISNLGMYDVENFLAIINPPEAAILAVASAREVPVVEQGTVKPGWRMKASLSVDHRLSDGAEGAKFMQALGVYLEQPLRLVME